MEPDSNLAPPPSPLSDPPIPPPTADSNPTPASPSLPPPLSDPAAPQPGLKMESEPEKVPEPEPEREREEEREGKTVEECLKEWRERRVREGVDERDCVLPFLTHDPRLVECKLCYRSIYPNEEIRCTVWGCQSAFHLNCAKKSFKISKEKIVTKDERNSRKRKEQKGLKFEGLHFKCPQHGCFVCRQVGYWRCVKCMTCSHTKCAPWFERVIIPPGQHTRAICWKHPSDWLLQNQHADVTQSIQEVFERLPVPYFEEEFSTNFFAGTKKADVAEKNDDVAEKKNCMEMSNADVAMKNNDMIEINDVVMKNGDMMETNDVVMETDDVIEKIDDVAEINDMVMKNGDVAEIDGGIIKNDDLSERNSGIMKNTEPDPFVKIRRNIYLVKRKRESHAGVGCTGCTSDSVCKEDCECRGLSVSCSKACHCSDFCTNKPFRKEKKIKIVKTENCGWGVITLEPLEKGDFIIEYIGEVIDDRTCEKRLWDIKERGDFNFYMCEISKDFTIDATFKGNISRFLNHSCDPNCKLEKWQVEGETRVGVFASKSIKVGEPLTYDYRFVHFGPMVKCKCGASNCQGFLGNKQIVNQLPINNMSQELMKEEIMQMDEEKLLGWGQKTKRSEITKIRNQTPSNSIDFQNQFTINQTNSNDSQNHFEGNQTPLNDSQNQLNKNQTTSNDSHDKLMRIQIQQDDTQNQLINDSQNQLTKTPQNLIITNQTPQNQLIMNQTRSNDVQNQSSNDSQNQFNTSHEEISHSINRPFSWGRKIKRSYTMSVDQNGLGK